VPSSTSSSDFATADARLPALAWRRIWLGALCLCAAVLGAQEVLGRLAGFRPYVSDDAGLWSLQRSGVPARDRRALVFAGKSRMLLTVDLDVTRAVTGVNPRQLALVGASPVPVLRDLAADASFEGRVICEFSEDDIVWFPADPAAERVRHHRGRSFSADFERRLRLLFEERVVFPAPQLSPRALAGSLWQGRWPSPPAWESRADRWRPVDFTKLDSVALRTASVEGLVRDAALTPTPSPAEFLAAARDVDALARAIQRRGGRVVFVRFPSSGRRWEFEESRLPKRLYWDVFAAGASARTIHFSDYAELARYDLPDWSHLDRKDAPGFTRALLAILTDDLR
jgi:hypothetical protein